MARVEVDKDRCISTGFCVADAPAMFEFDEEGLAGARPSSDPLPEEYLREIAANCPVGAIVVTE